MSSVPYQFREVTQGCLDKTKAGWMAFAQANPASVSHSYYASRLDYLAGVFGGGVTSGDNKPKVYGVFDSSGSAPQVASALATVVYVNKGVDSPRIKMMDLSVEPGLNLADGKEPDVKRLSWISAVAIMGVLTMSYGTHPASEIRVLGNMPLTRAFLAGVSVALMDDNFEVGSHGSWIVVSKRQAT